MKVFTAIAIVLILAVAGLAQTPVTATTPQGAFMSTTYNFSLTPITLPGSGTTLAGVETDDLINFSTNNALGYTGLISSQPFLGGRYDRGIPQVAKWLQKQTALSGYNFQFYVTVSAGVVKAAKNYWGERGGLGLRWAPSGSSNFSVAFEAQANNLPGISHWVPSLTVSPQFRF